MCRLTTRGPTGVRTSSGRQKVASSQRKTTRMKAVTFSNFGGPEVLEVKELPEPQPGPGQVRVKVAAATVNPTDMGFRQGGQRAALGDLQPPYIPGMELAGTVDATGDGVLEWKTGDRVMAIVIPRRKEGGAMAESVVVPAAS